MDLKENLESRTIDEILKDPQVEDQFNTYTNRETMTVTKTTPDKITVKGTKSGEFTLPRKDFEGYFRLSAKAANPAN